jgi:hypothetical protein
VLVRRNKGGTTTTTRESCVAHTPPWNEGADLRRGGARRLVVLGMLTALIVVVPLAATGSTNALSIPGFAGFITNDGLFFVQLGYQDLLGETNYVGNGTQVYAGGVVVNVTAITATNQVAHISIYDYASGSTVSTVNIVVPAYTYVTVDVALPQNHTWTEYRLTVDSTPWWFVAFTPYTFLGFTGLEDGGLDLAGFIGIAIFLAWALPLMIKSERMTKRAIYSPKWKAWWWLHGIVIGLVALYVLYFQWWNMTFHGWEYVVIPIPEAIFLFFWNAGRHSKDQRSLFFQIVPRTTGGMDVVLASYMTGMDPAGNLTIMRMGSVVQWWYRSRGHHTPIYRYREVGVPEPFHMNVLERTGVTEDQVRNPTRFPRTARFFAHDDFPVVTSGEDEPHPFERVYFVPSMSDFKKPTWPRMRVTKEKTVPAHTDLATSTLVPETTKTVWCWPYITDGHAEVRLWSWHYMDALAIARGYSTVEGLIRECENLTMQLAAEMGFRYTETDRNASERINAEEDIRNRLSKDLREDQLDQYVTPLPSGRRGRKDMAGGGQAAE